MNEAMQDSATRNLAPSPSERLRRILGSQAAALALLALLFAAMLLAAGLRGIPADRLGSLAVHGVLLGGILALGAIGLTLIYGVLNLPNFAHGDLMSVGAYLVLMLLPLLPRGAPLRPFSFGYELLVFLPVAMLLTGVIAYGVDRLIYRPLRGKRSSPVILAMASLGAAFFLRSLIYLIWGADFDFYYTGRARPSIELLPGVRARPDQLFILALALVLIALVYWLLQKTKMGKAMRATADNPELARVAGIDTERVVFWTWLIGGALAAAGGVMYGLDAQLRPEMGWWLLLPMFAGVVLGSIGSPTGALVGAMVIGVAWQVSSAFINPAYGPGVAFVIMILVLLFRPQGLFGKGGR